MLLILFVQSCVPGKRSQLFAARIQHTASIQNMIGYGRHLQHFHIIHFSLSGFFFLSVIRNQLSVIEYKLVEWARFKITCFHNFFLEQLIFIKRKKNWIYILSYLVQFVTFLFKMLQQYLYDYEFWHLVYWTILILNVRDDDKFYDDRQIMHNVKVRWNIDFPIHLLVCMYVCVCEL